MPIGTCGRTLSRQIPRFAKFRQISWSSFEGLAQIHSINLVDLRLFNLNIEPLTQLSMKASKRGLVGRRIKCGRCRVRKRVCIGEPCRCCLRDGYTCRPGKSGSSVLVLSILALFWWCPHQKNPRRANSLSDLLYRILSSLKKAIQPHHRR